MRKQVFNIITNQYINGNWGVGDIAFSITSKKKALDQMDTIHKLIETGEWFCGGENHYSIETDTMNPLEGQPRFIRDIIVKCEETEVLIIYRMVESPLNSTYISK